MKIKIDASAAGQFKAEKPTDGMDINAFLNNVNTHIKDVIRCMPEKLAA